MSDSAPLGPLWRTQGDEFDPESGGKWVHDELFAMVFPNKENPIPWEGPVGFANLQTLLLGSASMTTTFSPGFSKLLLAPMRLLMNSCFRECSRPRTATHTQRHTHSATRTATLALRQSHCDTYTATPA